MSSTIIRKQALTEVSTTRKDPLGAIIDEGGKRYKYVELKNVTATVAGVAGDPVSYTAAGVGLLNERVVLDATDADAQPICAGFLLGTVVGTAGTSYYVWVQLTGRVVVPTAVTSGVVGTGCMMATGDKTLTVTTGVIHTIAVAMTATAANNVVCACVPH